MTRVPISASVPRTGKKPLSSSSDRHPIAIVLPDEWSEILTSASGSDVDRLLKFAESAWPDSSDRLYRLALQELSLAERRTEARLRKGTAIGLSIAGSIVLIASLVLIFTQAFGLTHLPDAAITALIASVPAEIIAMTQQKYQQVRDILLE